MEGISDVIVDVMQEVPPMVAFHKLRLYSRVCEWKDGVADVGYSSLPVYPIYLFFIYDLHCVAMFTFISFFFVFPEFDGRAIKLADCSRVCDVPMTDNAWWL